MKLKYYKNRLKINFFFYFFFLIIYKLFKSYYKNSRDLRVIQHIYAIYIIII